MKRDTALVRVILPWAEKPPGLATGNPSADQLGEAFAGVTADQLYFHLQLMKEGGLVELVDLAHRADR